MIENPLKFLEEHREAILVAELGAILHNLGKILPEFELKTTKTQGPGEDFDYRLIAGICARHYPKKLNHVVHGKESAEATESIRKRHSIPEDLVDARVGELPQPFDDRNDYKVGDLVEFQNAKWYKADSAGTQAIYRVIGSSSRLTELLGQCHHQASGSEKRPPQQELGQKVPWTKLKSQDAGKWHISTVFGHEVKAEFREEHIKAVGKAGLQALEAIRSGDHTRRDEALESIRKAFACYVADSQRPLNDVRVSDIGFGAAAFFKPALVSDLLNQRWSHNDRKWRLARLAIDGPGFVGRATRVPDALIRRKLCNLLLDRVRDALQHEAPMANEVYRDDRGSVFLLEGSDTYFEMVRSRIAQVWSEELQIPQVSGALQPDPAGLELAHTVYKSEPFRLNDNAEGHSGYSFQLAQLLQKPPLQASILPSAMRSLWGTSLGEVCTVCGVRPFGGKKAEIRNVCDICEVRREDRCLEWIENRSSTIWVDESADINGRLALVAARFRLQPWLTDGGFIESTLFINHSARTTKSPSFARLARVWETTSDFWTRILKDVRRTAVAATGRVRFQASGRWEGKVVRSHAYYLECRGFRFNVICTASGHGRASFITAENLDRARFVLNLSGSKEGAAEAIMQLLRSEPMLSLEEPTGYGAANHNLGSAEISEVSLDEMPYSPIIEIQRDPSLLMFLAPGNVGIKAVECIRDLYNAEMGKVKDRLAVDCALAYAPTATPMHAILDAGRRMLARQPATERWTLSGTNTGGQLIGRGFEWDIDEGSDKYYSFLRSATPNTKLLHASELQPETEVKVEPSTFDFEFLDTASRRFEVAYDANGRRRGDRAHRPLKLEQLRSLRDVWNIISVLATSQIKNIDGLLSAKSQEWDALSKEFIEATLLNAAWPKDGKPSGDKVQTLVDAAQSGIFHDAVEIFLSIEKQKSNREAGGLSAHKVLPESTQEAGYANQLQEI